MTKTIRCRSVSKIFKGDGVNTNALSEVDLTFQEGEFISIVGSSGSGKSTLLSLLGTLDQPTSGKIIIGDTDVSQLKSNHLADFRFKNIGFIFQQFHLLPTLTALENVMVPLFSRRVPYNKKQRAESLLSQVKLQDKFHSLPSQLSGGQQQRVAIARALVQEPHWLLADEPTGNLDTETGNMIFELLSSLNKEKGCGVIFVTHDQELAEKSNRIIEMKDGMVVSDQKVMYT